MTVNNIKAEFFTLQELAQDHTEINLTTGEVTDNTIPMQQLLAEIEGERDAKADAIAALIRNNKANADELQKEIVRLQARKKAEVNAAANLTYLLDFLLGGEKLKTLNNTFYYATTKAVVVEDDSKVPAEFISFVPKIDKTALNKAVKDGAEFDGISLVPTTTLRIK